MHRAKTPAGRDTDDTGYNIRNDGRGCWNRTCRRSQQTMRLISRDQILFDKHFIGIVEVACRETMIDVLHDAEALQEGPS